MEHNNPAKISLIGFYLRNLAANIFGNLIIVVLNFFSPLAVYEDWHTFLMEGGWMAIPIIFACIVSIGVLLQFLLQRPLAAHLEMIRSGRQPGADLQTKARRRLLNLPVVLSIVNLSMWIALSLVFLPTMSVFIEMSLPSFLFSLFRLIMVGLIISFISFFLIDDYSRKTLVPLFFPDGKLAAVPGGIKISILRRIRVLMGAGTNAPMVLLVGTLAFAVWELQDSSVSASQFGTEFLIFSVALGITFVVVAICLNFLVGKSILSPIKEMMRLVYQVRNGNFRDTVNVLSNDELGVLGDGMNEMTEGLIERDRMRRSLFLAKEVQQALLPQIDPQISGLDIASTSVYCDETGGDYFDYLGPEGQGPGKISLVIGDVSGHGVSAALLMATARAFLRQRSGLPGSISRIVSDVNCQLTRDVAESGGFMTLFYLTIDSKNRLSVLKQMDKISLAPAS